MTTQLLQANDKLMQVQDLAGNWTWVELVSIRSDFQFCVVKALDDFQTYEIPVSQFFA